MTFIIILINIRLMTHTSCRECSTYYYFFRNIIFQALIFVCIFSNHIVIGNLKGKTNKLKHAPRAFYFINNEPFLILCKR